MTKLSRPISGHRMYLASVYHAFVKRGTADDLRCRCGTIHVIPDSQIWKIGKSR